MKIIIKVAMALALASCATKSLDTTQHESRDVFTAKSKLDWIIEAARISNCVINNESFLSEVGKVESFTHTDKKTSDVVASLKNPSSVFTYSYKTKNPFSKVMATTYKSNKTDLYFNTRNNPRTAKAHVNTIFHESLHLWGYSHGDNSSIGKENSINYKVGEIAEKYVDDCSGVIITTLKN